jgi:hypothetical protein
VNELRIFDAPTIGEFWSYPQSRTFAELLIDCEEDRTVRAVLVGILREMPANLDGHRGRPELAGGADRHEHRRTTDAPRSPRSGLVAPPFRTCPPGMETGSSRAQSQLSRIAAAQEDASAFMHRCRTDGR